MPHLPLSRRDVTRALLTAPAVLAIAPAVGAAAPFDSSDTDVWEAAHARWLAAANAVETCLDQSDEAIDPLVDIEGRAMMALMAVPAPNGAVFAQKLRLYIEHEVGTWFVPDGKEATRALLADADRLAKGA